MSDYKLNYWIESVACSLEEQGVSLPQETIKAIAKDMINSAECEGMAFGHDAIPDPLNAEIEQLKKGYESRIKELEARDLVFRESVAVRRGVKVENVYIQNGSVMYDKRSP